MRRRLLSWLVLIAAPALHNAEEWTRDLPAWSSAYASLPHFISAYVHSGFSLALIIATILPVIAAIVIRRAAPQTEPAWLVLFAWALIANAAWHAVLSVFTWTLMPGIFTAVMLLAPTSLYVLSTMPSQQRSGRIVLWAVPVMVIVTIATLTVAAFLANLVGRYGS